MDFPSWGNLFKISPKLSKLRLFRKRNSLESSRRSQFLVDFPRWSKFLKHADEEIVIFLHFIPNKNYLTIYYNQLHK